MASETPHYSDFKPTTIRLHKNCLEQRRLAKKMKRPINYKKYSTEALIKKLQSISSDCSSLVDVHPIDKSVPHAAREDIKRSSQCVKVPQPYFRRNTEQNPVTNNHNANDKPTIFENLRKTAVLTFLVLILSIVLKNVITACDFPCYDYDVCNITDELDHLLYGQNDVVSKMATNLNYVDQQQIYIFTGGTGVGKTYAANIIAKNFPWKYNIQRIVNPHDKSSFQNIISGFARFDFNLLIVDSLYKSDQAFLMDFLKILMLVPRKVIVCLIFNIQEVTLELKNEVDLLSASNNISDAFADARIHHVLLVFNKLTEDDVKNCIADELRKVNLNYAYNVEKILQSIDYEYSGCKGVHSKVALL